MELYSGSFGLGTWISLQEQGAVEIRNRSPINREQEEIKRVTPASQDWKAFFEVCETLDIWNWTGDYIAKGIADGHQWRVHLLYPNREIKTKGSNLYPLTGESKRVLTGEWDGMKGEATPEFEAFWKAVWQLIEDS